MNYTGLVQVYQKPDPNNPWKPTATQASNWESILRVQIKGMNWDQSQGKYEKWHGENVRSLRYCRKYQVLQSKYLCK